MPAGRNAWTPSTTDSQGNILIDTAHNAAQSVQLREVVEADLAIFYAQQLDPEANHMAAFTAKDPADRAAFDAHWSKILVNDSIVIKTILFEEQVAGHISHFQQFGDPAVSYWIGKDYWGKGIATEALKAFLGVITVRPLFARAVKDNLGSIRVLEKCGFVIFDEDTGFSEARGVEVEEHMLRLD